MNPYREPAEMPIEIVTTNDVGITIEADVIFENGLHVYGRPEHPIVINGVKFIGTAFIPYGTVFPKR